MTERQKKMSEKIMDDIESEELQMHSKVYFRVLQISLVAVTGIFLILSALITVIIFRDIKYGEKLGLRGFGGPGFEQYMQTLPWLAIIFGLLTFLISYTLVKRFEFGYKSKFYTMLGALVFAVAGLSIIFAGTGAGNVIVKTSPFRGLHSFGRYSDEHVITGEVIYVEPDHLTIFSSEGKKIEVHYSDRYEAPRPDYEVGEIVYIVGENKNGVFEAIGIKRGRKPVPPHTPGIFPQILK